jgi:molybdate transport system substrate-binding protein
LYSAGSLRAALTDIAAPNTLLAMLLNPEIKVGTSSPSNDPGGAYAWAMFKKAEAVRSGSRAILEGKALRMGNELAC